MSTQGRLVDPMVSGVLLLFGACVLYAAAQLQGGTETDPLGPRAFPTLIGIGFVGCGLALLIKSLAFRGHGEDGQGEFDEVEHADGYGDELEQEPARRHRMLLACSVISLYTLALPILGFLLATIVFMAAMILLQGGARRRSFVTVVVLFPASAYVLFTVLLSVRLPAGFFDPISLMGRLP